MTGQRHNGSSNFVMFSPSHERGVGGRVCVEKGTAQGRGTAPLRSTACER